MPVPAPSQIEALANSALAGANLNGKNAPDLAAALGQVINQSLSLFATMAVIPPGIPASVDPVSGSGCTSGPGVFLPPPAGAPDASQLESLAVGALGAKQLNGEQRGALAKVIAKTTAQAISLFAQTVQIAPGIAVAGFVTTMPASLVGAAPSKPMLRPLSLDCLQAEGLRGQNAPDLAGALAETLAGALSSLMSMVRLSPGIACSPTATLAPGRLV